MWSKGLSMFRNSHLFWKDNQERVKSSLAGMADQNETLGRIAACKDFVDLMPSLGTGLPKGACAKWIDTCANALLDVASQVGAMSASDQGANLLLQSMDDVLDKAQDLLSERWKESIKDSATVIGQKRQAIVLEVA